MLQPQSYAWMVRSLSVCLPFCGLTDAYTTLRTLGSGRFDSVGSRTRIRHWEPWVQGVERVGQSTSRLIRRRVWALTATMIVLMDMNTAPIAGGISNPSGTAIPMASGTITML